MALYQTYLKDCECKNGGIIIKDNVPICRWCRIPYGKGGCKAYREEHFQKESIKDYEILERGEFHEPVRIKRVKDGEVFEKGETTEGRNIIEGFQEVDGYIKVKMKTPLANAYWDTNLVSLKKVKKPLFTTEDGVPIYEEDEIILFSESSFITHKIKVPKDLKTHPFEGNNKRFKYFSTEEASREYIIKNKPVLSYLDIAENINYCNDGNQSILLKMMELVKEKIKL